MPTAASTRLVITDTPLASPAATMPTSSLPAPQSAESAPPPPPPAGQADALLPMRAEAAAAAAVAAVARVSSPVAVVPPERSPLRAEIGVERATVEWERHPDEWNREAEVMRAGLTGTYAATGLRTYNFAADPNASAIYSPRQRGLR